MSDEYLAEDSCNPADTNANDPESWSAAAAETVLNVTEMDELIKRSKVCWDAYDAAKRIASDAYAAAEKIDAKVLEELKKAGKSKYFVDGVGTMSIVQKLQVTTPKTEQQKCAFFAYLQKLGTDIFYAMATVNSNTLNAWYSSKVEEATSRGETDVSVPGLDQPTMRETLRFRKG